MKSTKRKVITMKELNNPQQNKLKEVFFTVKTLALFLCMMPLFGKIYYKVFPDEFEYFSIFSLIFFGLMFVTVTFLYHIMRMKKKKANLFLKILEIGIFFGITLASIIMSGASSSQYKYLFILAIVVYTIEFGMKVGIGIAVASCVALLSMDVMQYITSSKSGFFQSDITLIAIFLLIAWIFGYYVKLEGEHIEELRNLAHLDGLTRVYNHRYFFDLLKKHFDYSEKNKTPLSVIMLDIDYFKNYNDMFGHQQGDVVLKELVSILRANLDEKTLISRYGGEEFTIILPGKTQKEALIVAEKLRQAVYNHKFPGDNLIKGGHLTISVGVAEKLPDGDNETALMERVDAAMYRAKYFRKNRVEAYSSVFDSLAKYGIAPTETTAASIKSLITIINSRDHYTYYHTERVVFYCETFANHIGLPAEQKKILLMGAYLHDIGKINISKEILIASRKLNDDEWAEIKKHPVEGVDIIEELGGFDQVIPLVLQHHERYDGKGYPYGLRGEEISILARMLTVCDCFDAMTSNRPYQARRSYEEAFEELRRHAGTQFDPTLVEQFIDAINVATSEESKISKIRHEINKPQNPILN